MTFLSGWHLLKVMVYFIVMVVNLTSNPHRTCQITASATCLSIVQSRSGISGVNGCTPNSFNFVAFSSSNAFNSSAICWKRFTSAVLLSWLHYLFQNGVPRRLFVLCDLLQALIESRQFLIEGKRDFIVVFSPASSSVG